MKRNKNSNPLNSGFVQHLLDFMSECGNPNMIRIGNELKTAIDKEPGAVAGGDRKYNARQYANVKYGMLPLINESQFANDFYIHASVNAVALFTTIVTQMTKQYCSVSSRTVMKLMGWASGTAQRALNELIELRALIPIQKARGSLPAIYRVNAHLWRIGKNHITYADVHGYDDDPDDLYGFSEPDENKIKPVILEDKISIGSDDDKTIIVYNVINTEVTE